MHKTYTSITHGSYSAAVVAGQFPPRLVQSVNFLSDCIVSATNIGGQRWLTQIGWCSRLLKPTLFRGCFSRSIPPAAGSASQFPQRLHSKCYNRRASVADTSRLVQPVAQTYITNSRQVDWLGGWIGGYMLCGWCSLSINCTHGGWLVHHVVAMLSSGFLSFSTATVGLSGKASLQLAATQQW